MKKFPTSLDRTSVIVTWSIVGLAVVLSFISFFAFNNSANQIARLLSIVLGPVLIVAIFIAMFYLKPISIVVNEEGIIIDRKIKPVFVNFSDIRTIRIVTEDEMGFPFRTFGDGGIFGYIGLYYNKKLGSMMWYCTKRENYVLIEKTNGKKIIITPDDPGALLNELKLLKPSIVQL